jgi:hypothetical protein
MNSDLRKLAYCSRSEIRGTGKGVASSILGFSGKPQLFWEMQKPKWAVCSRLAAILRRLFIDSFGGGLHEVERGGSQLHSVMWLGIG